MRERQADAGREMGVGIDWRVFLFFIGHCTRSL